MEPVVAVLNLARACSKRESPDSSAVLPFAGEALSIIAAHPELKDEFEGMFVAALGTGEDPEFVEVCAHALRWASLRLRFERLYLEAVTRNDWRAAPVFQRVIEAHEDKWAEDARDFYGDFFEK